MSFEVTCHDLAARLGRIETNHGTIETPTLLPVISPRERIIPPRTISEFGADAVITNAYFLKKEFAEECIDKGVHGFLEFDGSIMTDSGAFQAMNGTDVGLTNGEIIEFQKRIGVDIGIILDEATASRSRGDVEDAVNNTIASAKEAVKLIGGERLWTCPVQGSVFPDLVRKSAKAASKLDAYGVYALGSVVPLMERYDFDIVVRAIAAAKGVLPPSKPLHLFGGGHPMFFSFAVALGVDLFDSASYALYAREGRYLTENGTAALEDLSYFPCDCRACRGKQPEGVRALPAKERERLLAEHNLSACFLELRKIRQAIREGSLWELLEQRCRSHPSLVAAMRELVKARKLLGEANPVSKRHLFIVSEFSKKNPDLLAAKERLSRVSCGEVVGIKPFGNIPITVTECYPFAQTVSEGLQKVPRAPNNLAKASAISQYWLGADVFRPGDSVSVSRTQKIRSVSRNGELLATIRASDSYLILHGAARDLHSLAKPPAHRVVVNDDAAPFVSEGKSVFARFVKACYPSIRPGEQVLVVNERDELLASGDALLSGRGMLSFRRGPAVVVRSTFKTGKP